jgi:hypothetical protein
MSSKKRNREAKPKHGDFPDPTVASVVHDLEKVMNEYMDGVAPRLNQLNSRLAEAMAINPKSSERKEAKECSTPLLKRIASERVLVKCPDDVFPNNDALLEQLDILTQEAHDLSHTFETIFDWIAINAPQLKEEQSVGVEIMEAVKSQILDLLRVARGQYTVKVSYLSDRVRMEKTAMKHGPSKCVSTMKAIDVLDSEYWDVLEQAWRVLVRCVIIAHDVLDKNMAKLKDPSPTPEHVMMNLFM